MCEHFTTPPKRYTEDTLLSAMERAGAAETDNDVERKGLGTPATRAACIEKLIKSGVVERKARQLAPTRDGMDLIAVLPERLTSPLLTVKWENALKQVECGSVRADRFMNHIETFTRETVEEAKAEGKGAGDGLFEKEAVGVCPRCGKNVVESKHNFHCEDKSCGFVLWKNDRFFTSKKKTLTGKMAAALLKDGKVKVKGLYSEKSGKIYDAVVVLADTGGKYVNFKLEFEKG